MNAVVEAPAAAPPIALSNVSNIPAEAGSAFGGGLKAGCFFVGSQAYALIVAPKGEGEHDGIAWGAKKEISGALSCNNGLANTLAMEAAGSAAAKWARALRIDGFDDWYIPSRIEALILFAELREQFERDWYWTSTQFAGSPEYAWFQYFNSGYQSYSHKDYELRARAVRRVPIS